MDRPDTDGTRRSLLRAGVALGLAAATPRWLCAQEALPLATRPIPSTGERLPAIGVGTNAFGNAGSATVRALLERMAALGGSVVDTAAAYGRSEEVIGEALAGTPLRARLFIATKLVGSGRDGAPRGPMAADGVGGAASLQRSLARLRTDRLDLLQVHALDGTDELMPQLLEWKQAGRVRYVGVTTSDTDRHGDLMEAMRRHPLDFIQVDYSLANREAAQRVLPLAQERRIAVLVNLPLGRAALLRTLQGRELPGWAAEIDAQSWAQVLLKYVVSHPAVTTAIPGSTRLEHLEDNQRAARGRLPDEALRRAIERYWDSIA